MINREIIFLSFVDNSDCSTDKKESDENVSDR